MPRKGKPMSPALKAFLKKHGRFPKKGELRGSRKGRKRRARHAARSAPTMARRHRFGRRRGHRSAKIPILTLGILAGQAAVAWASTGDALNAVDQFQSYYTGYVFMHKAFRPGNLVIGYAPWLAKGLISKFGRPLGAVPRVPKGIPISIS